MEHLREATNVQVPRNTDLSPLFTPLLRTLAELNSAQVQEVNVRCATK